MSVTCTRCAAELPEGARFCHVCGTKVQEERVAHSHYMTVLFCDLANSTGLTGKLGDEAMFSIVTCYQEICNESVPEHGGYVAKYMGDGMLAYFGYPETLKNSAAQAVKAAHEIITRTSGIRVPGETLSASAGVATGWMVVADANTGAAAAEAMAIGGTVNLAARLQAEAGLGRIAVSTETSQRLDPGQFALQPLGMRMLKGFEAPAEVWVAAPSGEGGRASVFVGRRSLLDALAAAWAEARNGAVVSVILKAPGGFGKTSLAEEFVENSVAESDIFVIRGEIHRREQSFAAFRNFTLGLAGISGTLAADAQRHLLANWAPEGTAPGLEVLCGLNEAPVPPILRNQMIEQSLRETLAARLPQDASVLLLEDAHWFDVDSATLIGTLPETLSDRGLLILASRRPEGTDLPLPEATLLTLGPMAKDEAEAVISALDTGHSLSPSVRSQIAERAAGVPLYVEQITRAVLERDSNDAGEGIPPNMVEALLERIGNLKDARSLVEAAAVLGTDVRVSVLAQMLSTDEAQVARHIAELVRRSLFRPSANGTVSFDHALLRDAVLETVLAAQRRRLHGSALEAYEAAAPELLEAAPVTHATHLMGSDRVVEAIPKLIEAARAALARGEIAESVRLLRWAGSRLDEVPEEDGLRDDLELALSFTLGLSLVQHRGFSDTAVGEAYGRALELCLATERSGETEFQIAWGIWAHYTVIGEFEGAMSMSRRMNEIAVVDPELKVLAASVRSLMHCNQGDLAAQEEAHAETLRRYVLERHRMQAVTYSMDSLELATLFRVHGRCIAGDLPGWQEAFAFSRSHEEALGLPFLRPYIHIYSSAPNSYAHTTKAYRAEMEEAVAYAAEYGQPFWVISGHVWLAHETVRNGSDEEGVTALEAAIGQMRAIGVVLGRVYHLATLARGYALVGRADEAEATITEALHGIGKGRDLLYAPEVMRLRGEVTLLNDPEATEAARAQLDEARRLAAEKDHRAWLALIAGSEARLNARTLGEEEAQELLDAQVVALVRPGSEEHPAFVTAKQALTLSF